RNEVKQVEAELSSQLGSLRRAAGQHRSSTRRCRARTAAFLLPQPGRGYRGAFRASDTFVCDRKPCTRGFAVQTALSTACSASVVTISAAYVESPPVRFAGGFRGFW